MDHLPHFQDYRESPFHVPYLCSDTYFFDKLGFENYPDRAKFNYQSLLAENVTLQSVDAGAPFLQAWLYFGLLHEVFDNLHIPIDLDSFIVERNGTKYITTAPLPNLMENLVTVKIPSHSTSYFGNTEFSNAAWGRSSRKVPYPKSCLETACKVMSDIVSKMNILDSQLSDHTCDTQLSSAQLVLLSVIILGETLDVYRQTGQWPGRKSSLKWPLPTFLTRFMIAKGWCAFEVHTLYHKYPAHGYQCYLLCTLASQKRSRLNYDHCNCTLRSCNAYQVEKEFYTSVHVRGPQNSWDPALRDYQCCEHAAITDHAKVASIINDGEIPLLTVSADDSGAAQISCHRSGLSLSPLNWAQHFRSTLNSNISANRMTSVNSWAPKTRYVAISHVWSDGLGNPANNSLPGCQLLRLQSMVNELYEDTSQDVPFWIDTLCVPLNDEATRSRAIEQMYRVYDGADKVLVLDASIIQCSQAGSLEERVMNISCSPWAQRLWTYQEGVLAHDLYFRFAQGATSYRALKAEKIKMQRHDARVFHFKMQALCSSSDRRAHMIENAFENLLGVCRQEERNMRDTACLRPILQIWPLLSLVGDQRRHGDGLDMQTVCWNLKDRSTSHASDECICLAILMKPKMITTMRETVENERMKKLMCSFVEINYEIICWEGLRYQEDGYRWIPRTLLTGFDSMAYYGTRTAMTSFDVVTAGAFSPIRAYITRSGRLSIKQNKPVLGLLYLQNSNDTELSPTSRMVLATGGKPDEYHEVIASIVRKPVSWRSFSGKRLAVMYLYENPRTLTPIGLERYANHPPIPLSEARAVLVSYRDDPIYFEERLKQPRDKAPPYLWRKCGGDFRFEANITSITPRKSLMAADVVCNVVRYQTDEADCCLEYNHTQRFKPPNWFIG